MNDDSPQWRYEDAPPREWSWSVARDPNLESEADRYVKLPPDGLEYTGNAWHPNRGGGYSIGFPSDEQFPPRGDPVVQLTTEAVPATLAV